MEKSNRFNCPTCADCWCCISTVFLAMDEMVLQILMYVKTSGKAFFTARKRSTGTPPRKVHPPAGTLPGQVLTPGRYPPGTHPGRYSPRYTPPGQVHLPLGRYTPVGTPLGRYTPTTVHAGIRSTSGRYASHWNAFLLLWYIYTLLLAGLSQ